MTHDQLARSLADHLRADRRMVWCDLQLGPSGSPRPDVYAIYKSYTHPTPTAFEVKVSRSDFLADVTSGKWQSYLPFASGVSFACVDGLVKKAEVPDHCGLYVLGAKGWRAAKRPILRPVTIPQDALLKLLIDGVEREGPIYRKRRYDESDVISRIRAKFGEIAARTIRNRVAVDYEIDGAKHTAARIIEQANRQADQIRKEATDNVEPLRAELCAVLGLTPTADRWQIRAAVQTLRSALDEHPAHHAHRRFTEIISRAMEQHGYRAPEPAPAPKPGAETPA